MADPVIRVEHLSKQYRLGTMGAGTLREDLQRWWARRRGMQDPLSKVGAAAQHALACDHWALRDVSLDVRRGEVLGIIGRNGAGKSTLLKILSRITAPTAGRALIRGRIASLLEVGTGMHPELTGRENIYLNGTILGMRRAEVSRKLDEIIEFAEVRRFVDTPVKRYSSGMRVRLGFAVAAHLEPEILVVDEVLAVGDAAFQAKSVGKLKDVSHHGRTVLFVSHNMGMISSLCSEAVVMAQGRVAFRGAPHTAISKYLESGYTGKSPGNATFEVYEQVLARQTYPDFHIDTIELCCAVPDGKIRTGAPARIRLKYSASGLAEAPAVVVSIRHPLGQELIRLSTMPISGYELGPAHRRGEVVLTIDSLPLVGGTYELDVGLVRERVEWLARLNGVARFEVQVDDFYSSGFPLDQTRGLVVTKHSWDHRPLEDAMLP